MKSNKYLYLGLGVFLFIISLLTESYLSNRNHNLSIKKEIERNVSDQISRAIQKLEFFEDYAKNKQKIVFSELLEIEERNPVLIYKHDSLVFWNKPVTVSNGLVNIEDSLFFYKNNKEKFLAVKKSIADKTLGYSALYLILLEKKDAFKRKNSGFNEAVFGNLKPLLITANKLSAAIQIRSKQDKELFYVKLGDNNTKPSTASTILIILGVIFLIISIIIFFKKDTKRRIYKYIYFFLIALLIKLVPFIYQIFIEKSTLLFLEKSPGKILYFIYDALILNLFLFLVLRENRKISFFKNIFQNTLFDKILQTSLLVFICYGITYITFFMYRQVFFLENLTIDVSKSLSVNLEISLAFSLLILLGLLLFFTINVLCKIIAKTCTNIRDVAFSMLIGASSFYLTLQFIGYKSVTLFNISTIVIVILIISNSHRKLSKLSFSNVFNFLIIASLTAVIGTIVIVEKKRYDNALGKSNFIQLLTESNPNDEKKLAEMMNTLKKDTSTVNNFLKEDTKEFYRIVNKQSGQKLTKFVIAFHVISKEDSTNSIYKEFLEKLKRPEHRTENESIFFINELESGNKRYICTLPVISNQDTLGKIIADASYREPLDNIYYANSTWISDELINHEDYSYAIFKNENLAFSFGSFSYPKHYIKSFWNSKGFYNRKLEDKNYEHLRVPIDLTRHIIVTSIKPSFVDTFSNFSLIFLLMAFLIFSIVPIREYLINKRKLRNLNFSTRVQFYLNITVFLPLIIASVVSVAVLTSSSRAERERILLEKSEIVSNSLKSDFYLANDKFYNDEEFKRELEELARLLHIKISIYNKEGYLITDTNQGEQSIKQEKNLINPLAYLNIIDKKAQNYFFTSEKSTREFYDFAYVGIKSIQHAEVAKVIEITPRFKPENTIENQNASLITPILNSFTVVFLILLILGYLSFYAITYPIKILTQKIKQTALGGNNRPIQYNVKDEFGSLIAAYNKMILNLEESREALKQSEKETAWRELAKQVAHEIKNPLTPIRLNLQQLQRKFLSEDQKLQVIIDQLDIISDIADSFSSFATMPLPKEEKVDIKALLQEVLNLHISQDVKIKLDYTEDNIFIKGDNNLFARIFSNLILNAIQAIPENREKIIEISLVSIFPDRALAEIKDNGAGIPKEIQHKIFAPNFSTKTQGSGIGLAMAKRGIEHFKGNIWFETSPQGTSFFVELTVFHDLQNT